MLDFNSIVEFEKYYHTKRQILVESLGDDYSKAVLDFYVKGFFQ